jgi:RES domain-containing protein
MVSRCYLEKIKPADYLYTSGYSNRYNPDKIRALYVSGDATTAGEEWERRSRQMQNQLQQVLYSVEASVVTLDLGDATILAALNLTQADLTAPWQFVPRPSTTQRLGEAVSKQQRFSAIRYPSDAARVRGFNGFNMVIFPTAIVVPQSVIIYDDRGIEIQRWP